MLKTYECENIKTVFQAFGINASVGFNGTFSVHGIVGNYC